MKQLNRRDTTGTDHKIRVECWLSRSHYIWLRGLAITEDRSMSSVLRKALRSYIQQAQKEYAANAGGHRE